MLERLLYFPFVQFPIAIRVKVLVAFLHISEEQVQPLELLEVDGARAIIVVDPALQSSMTLRLPRES